MSEFSPLMLTMARESRTLSQTALAKAAGISQSAISQMESGLISPSPAVAAKVAEVLGYETTLLYAAVRFQQLPITFFRKKARVAARDVSAIRSRVNLHRLRAETLLRAVEVMDPRLLLIDLQKEGLTPTEAAQRLRVYWNIRPGPINDLTTLVEKSGVVVVPIDFGTAAVDGLSLFEPADSLPPMIFLSRSMPADRWRLTLAHELAHVILHHHLPIPPSADQMEDEAFEFAGEFLMPVREIKGQLARLTMQRLAALKKHWRVSMASLVMRARRLGLVSPRQERGLWVQLSRGGRAEPVLIDPEHATLLRSLVNRHLEELGYSVKDLSRALHLKVEEFRGEYGLAAAPLRLA